MMMDKENEFFGELKNDNFEDGNISSSGINYGAELKKSNTKSILIAIGFGAVFAGAFILLFSSDKKSQEANNLADIPTISSPTNPIKLIPVANNTNEVFKTTTIYDNPTNFEEEEKSLIITQTISAPTPTLLPKLPVKPIKKVATKKAIPFKSPVKKFTPKKVVMIEKATSIKGEVEISKAPSKAIIQDGIWNVQLTSTGSESAAKKEWENLSKKYPSILSKQSHTINRTEVNGKTYYRLRVSNLSSSTQAAEICNKLKTYKVSCFVTK